MPRTGDGAALGRLQAAFAQGQATVVATAEELPQALANLPRRVEAPVPTLHRRIAGHDVLFVPATASRASEVANRDTWWDIDYSFDPSRYLRNITVRVQGAKGTPQLWNPLDGTRQPLPARVVGDGMEVDIPFDESPAALVVWGEEEEPAGAVRQAGGTQHEVVATLQAWQAQVEPTLDNRYGDFDRPAHVGAPPVQTWRFEHQVENTAGRGETWRPVEATFGTYGWWLGPRPVGEMPQPARSVEELRDSAGGWQAARYSLTRGIAHDRVHGWTLGPKGHVPYEFLEFGAVYPGQAVRFPNERDSGQRQANCIWRLAAGAAKRLWVNGELVGSGPAGYLWLQPVTLRAGGEPDRVGAGARGGALPARHVGAGARAGPVCAAGVDDPRRPAAAGYAGAVYGEL